MKLTACALTSVLALVSPVYGGDRLTEKQFQALLKEPLLTYQANKLGGFDFFRDGRYIAASEPMPDERAQNLYVLPQKLAGGMRITSPTPVLTISSSSREMANWSNYQYPPAVFYDSEMQGVLEVLQEKPDVSAKRRPVPIKMSVSQQKAAKPPNPSQVGAVSAEAPGKS